MFKRLLSAGAALGLLARRLLELFDDALLRLGPLLGLEALLLAHSLLILGLGLGGLRLELEGIGGQRGAGLLREMRSLGFLAGFEESSISLQVSAKGCGASDSESQRLFPEPSARVSPRDTRSLSRAAVPSLSLSLSGPHTTLAT